MIKTLSKAILVS